MGQKLIPLPATLLLPKSLEGSPKEGTLPEGQLWHARWAESRAQLFHPFRKWLMVRECQMRQSKTLWHFYFQSGGKKKKKTTTIKQSSTCRLPLPAWPCFCPGRLYVAPNCSLARSMRPPWTESLAAGASSAPLHSALSRTPHTPSEAPGCQIYPLPMGA